MLYLLRNCAGVFYPQGGWLLWRRTWWPWLSRDSHGKAVTGTARGKPDEEAATAAREAATTMGRAATVASTSVRGI